MANTLKKPSKPYEDQAACCSVCMDEDEPVTFRCSNRTCTYQLCTSCIRDSFKDSSGANSSKCQICRTPSAMDMIAAVIGTGAIKAVERKVRSSIEFDLRAETVKREGTKKITAETNSRAREIFNNISEAINLKCPRCGVVFHDYDGCNALRCSKEECRAAFCAICLADCGTDAHQHVRSSHGNLFDKKAFNISKLDRSRRIISNTIEDFEKRGESFELIQLVKNHIDKAKLLDGSSDNRARTRLFLQDARRQLLQTVKDDRLSILSDPEDYAPGRKHILTNNISPRSTIPDEFQVTLSPRGEKVFLVTLEYNDNGKWKSIAVDTAAQKLQAMGVPCSDNVVNLVQSIKCCVVAIENQQSMFQTSCSKPPKSHNLSNDEVCISFQQLSRDGSLDDNNGNMTNAKMRILGLNPNLRMLKLEKHVTDTPDADLMFTALKHLIGDGKPTPVFTEILRPLPKSQNTLNTEQQQVAHPLRLKTANEVAGPPGTGKTKTIVELVRSLLECTDYDIVVQSERNGAINAIAEKFKEDSLVIGQKKVEIKDALLWLSLETYGSGEAMGESTQLFTLERKLSYHPDIVVLKEEKESIMNASKSLAQCMRSELANTIYEFAEAFNVDRAHSRGKSIELDSGRDFESPLIIIRYVMETLNDLKAILPKSGGKVCEKDAEDVILDRSAILGGLVEVRTDPEKKSHPKGWNAKYATQLLDDICCRLQRLQESSSFDEDCAMRLHRRYNESKENFQALQSRLSEELPKLVRLHMSTIGSSHKLPVEKMPNITDSIRDLSINEYDGESDGEILPPKKTIVIFDEAGCIPSYELLGLSRLGREIEALVLVGDKHQLPPYAASQGRKDNKPSRYGAHRKTMQKSTSVVPSSLLDASSLSIDDSKVLLTTQYRVPKDIADILNARIYRGKYNTSTEADVPLLGLKVVDVPEDRNPRKKYVNSNEINRGLDLMVNLNCDPRISSIMVITPYKNQQREFQYQMKRRNLSHPVLTIDQCQGQEADAVILSLVQKPTMFLTKNRLNVALSRVKKKLYVLASQSSLRVACSNSKWESRLLAGDLLSNDWD